MLTFGSLFSGIGGIDLGLERAGMKCEWQIENDEWCSSILAKHWPDVERHKDIRGVDAGRLRGVDVVAGGFPCQDLSYAGKRAGLSGEKSGLWSEFKRVVRVVGPRYVLVENVPGLLSRGMGVVLGDLASLGYDAEWESIPAAAFGAPHLRWRVFIVAYRPCEQDDALHGGPGRTGQLEGGAVEAGGEAVQQEDGTQGHDRTCRCGKTPPHARSHGCERRGLPDLERQGLSPTLWSGEGAVADAACIPEREPADEAFTLANSGGARHVPRSSGKRGAELLADADTTGLQGRSQQLLPTKEERKTSAVFGHDAAGCGDSRGSAEPWVGRGSDGLPRRLDGVVDNYWDETWEDGIPRTQSGVKQRANRLKGLGNAVVPVKAEFLGKLIVAHAERHAERHARGC